MTVQSAEARKRQLEEITEMLNTPTGQLLLDELRVVWNPTQMFDADPATLAYRVGQRDAFTLLEFMAESEDGR